MNLAGSRVMLQKQLGRVTIAKHRTEMMSNDTHLIHWVPRPPGPEAQELGPLEI